MSALFDRLRSLRPDARLLAEILAAAVLGALLLWIGARALTSARAEATRAAELSALLSATEGWVEGFRATSDEERQAWRAVEDSLASMRVAAERHLDVLERVSAAADRAGAPQARVRFTETVEGDSWRTGGAFVTEPADYGLAVELYGGYRTVAELVTGLPPAIEVRTASLERAEGGAHARLTLALYPSPLEPALAVGDARSMRPEALRALAPYLAPSPPVQVPGDVQLREEPPAWPARDPFATPYVEPPPVWTTEAFPDTHAGWRLAAILITDSRRVASIDGRFVTVGDTLAGGARVTAIEPRHVVVLDAEGETRILPLDQGAQHR